jgi:hypothetical protein
MKKLVRVELVMYQGLVIKPVDKAVNELAGNREINQAFIPLLSSLLCHRG